jgi:hypothetical protein
MSSVPHGLRREGGDERWRIFIEEKLAHLQATLPAGSDSWTAHRPANDVVKTAKEVAERFVTSVHNPLPNPSIAATSEGGIQLKWSTDGREFSLFVYPDRSIEYLYVGADPSKSKSGGVKTVHQVAALADLLLE